MSGRRDREERREERLLEEEKARTAERRRQLIKLGSAAAFLAVVGVAVLIVLSNGGGSGGDAGNLQDVAEVEHLLEGIPQKGMVLGEPSAKVTLLEFGDLQCPFCKANSEEVLPEVIENQVAGGQAKVSFNNFTIIGPQSVPAGAAAIAAGEQGRAWNFIELFYRNQGEEDSGYVTDEFMTAIAKAAGVPDIARWNKERKEKRLTKEVEATTARARRLEFGGTPSFAIEGPRVTGLKTLETSEYASSSALESAISAAG